MIGLSIGINSAAGRRNALGPIINKLNFMFPGYLSGVVHRCDVPPDPLWHAWVGALDGSFHDCARPLPGVTPDDGYFAIHDCNRSLP
jgi:hypothetical protein